MSRETHVWGRSRAADRLWSIVAGYGPSKAGKRLLMFLQACIDDSEDHNSGTFVLAGYIAPAAKWGEFSAEWEELVATDGVYDNPGEPRYFKMKRMKRPNRLPKVEGFYRIIERHASVALSCRFNVKEFERAKRRVFSRGVSMDLDGVDKYVFGYRALLDLFHTNRDGDLAEFLPAEEKVDFVFDFQKQGDYFLRNWGLFLENLASRPDNIAHLYGNYPIPRDEKEFLPLQAADLWAWWVRKWLAEGATPDALHRPSFGPFKEERDLFPKMHIEMLEDDITKTFMEMAADHLRPHQTVFDLGWSAGWRGIYGRRRD